ncbi:MAG: FAD-dependent oxidoreductase [Pyrinomonadaceae bacterium]|nr:FAD-dependent oxidoreductase [Sphingobacteriaceae bacterium]
MIKRIVLFICILFGFKSYAQNIKTAVLVVGAGPAGMAAAIQSAKSGVKTLLIDASNFNTLTLSKSDRSTNAGIYADFLKRAESFQKVPVKNDTVFSSAVTGSIFKGWADTVKNLTLLGNTSIKKIKRSGKGWQIDLPGREIKAEVLVDASANAIIAAMIAVLPKKNQVINPSSTDLYSTSLYRTSLGILENGEDSYKTLALQNFIVPEIENLVLINPAGEASGLQSGQAAGTIAAFCAFFKTTTKKLDTRKIQSELFTFKAKLIGFDDISDGDSSSLAIQHIALTGILKGKSEDNKLLFLPDNTVSTDDLKQPLREYYSRSQIWFLDNKADKITLEQALSLIKFIGSRGEELNKQVQKAWKSPLKLTGEYDLKKVLSRKELAILLDIYLQPFGVGVDLDGNVKR